MLYASDAFRSIDVDSRGALEENPDEIPDLVAEILTHEVERRLQRNLSFGWQTREAVVNRVRGRIELRYTVGSRLLDRGKVACRFDEVTIDTPRNRLVRAALGKLGGIVAHSDLARRCRSLSGRLESLGVKSEKPSRTDVSVDTFSRSDARDRLMVAAARLAFDLALPTEESGQTTLPTAPRNIELLRVLFERAVGGFYSVVLSRSGWQVNAGRTIRWPQDNPTSGVKAILPSMKTDIILDHPGSGQRVVIDTKFTAIVTPGHYREESLRSAYIYQIYAYLRSQEDVTNPLAANASGLLLHPSVGKKLDEAVVIQGHPIRFATVDLAGSAIAIRQRLLAVKDPHPSHVG